MSGGALLVELEKISSVRYSTELLIVENDDLDIDNIDNELLLDKADKRESIVDLNEEEESLGVNSLEIDKDKFLPRNETFNKDREGNNIDKTILPLG